MTTDSMMPFILSDYVCLFQQTKYSGIFLNTND